MRKSLLAIFMFCFACAFTLTTLMGVYAQQTRPPRQEEADKPNLPYWHMWTDENGVSRLDRCELSGFKNDVISSGAAPLWIDRLGTPAKHVVILNMPAGWVGEWHENPEPQWIVPLSGRWFVETMDGKRVEMGPGELSFGNDQNTKADAQGRTGHRSGAVGDQPCMLLLVQLDRATVNTPPCQLK
jgi:hypothetical protein